VDITAWVMMCACVGFVSDEWLQIARMSRMGRDIGGFALEWGRDLALGEMPSTIVLLLVAVLAVRWQRRLAGAIATRYCGTPTSRTGAQGARGTWLRIGLGVLLAALTGAFLGIYA